MNLTIGKFWQAADHMLDTVVGRLPALIVAVLIFVLFYGLSLLVSRFIRRAIPQRRQNLAVVFARLIGGATILIGFLVALSVVAPSFQAAELIKVLGIGAWPLASLSRTSFRISWPAYCCCGLNLSGGG